MSKTYRGWAEIDDWGSGREFRRPHKRKSELSWKQEALKEMEEVTAEVRVFVIHNEWTDEVGNFGSEIIDGQWYSSEEAALGRLASIAVTHGVELPEGEYGFTVEDKGLLQYDEYYIEELEAYNG